MKSSPLLIKKNHTVRKVKKILSVVLIILILLSVGLPGASAHYSIECKYIGDEISYQIGPIINTDNWTYSQLQLHTAYKNSITYYQNSMPNTVDKINNLESDETFYKFAREYQSITTEYKESLLMAGVYLSRSDKPEDSLINSVITRVNNSVDKILALVKDVEEARAYETDGSEPMSNSVSGIFELVNWLWACLGSNIAGASSGDFLSLNTTQLVTYAETFANVVKTFAYMVAVLLFGINVTETSLQFEITTLRGGVKVFGRLLLVKFWIDFSINICKYILILINGLASSIISASSNSKTLLTPPSSVLGISNIPIIGTIVDFLFSIPMLLPFLIIAIVIVVALMSIFVKLVVRNFELACLITVAPAFFATLVGGETKRYFNKFMGAFLSTCASLVFIAVVYVIGTQWITSFSASNTMPNDTLTWQNWSEYLINMAWQIPIIIGMARVICKPPKVFNGLLD